ncbi:hypothetical protein ABVN80_06800 [Acinetobacter baumannii]
MSILWVLKKSCCRIRTQFAETIEEERRLMYVELLRARQGLTLTLAEQRKNGGQMKQMTPSRSR